MFFFSVLQCKSSKSNERFQKINNNRHYSIIEAKYNGYSRHDYAADDQEFELLEFCNKETVKINFI